MTKATRTVNPLHFEDLEPHRFEDLIRQLIYDFRDWYQLEAVGRAGADQGVDIRGIERLEEPMEVVSEDDDTFVARNQSVIERLWIIQCKRYQRMGPKKVEQVIRENLSNRDLPPYGYIFAASCDFSDAARGTFYRLTSDLGVQERYLFGKAELEDLLFRPENDHLLFAYFGLSIKARRRSTRTRVRSNLTLKRALIRHFGEISSGLSHQAVLIRDPANADYPSIHNPASFLRQPAWRYWYFAGHQPPNHVAFVRRKFYAYLDRQTSMFDALLDYDMSEPRNPKLFGLPEERFRSEQADEYHALWFNEIPERFRAWYYEIATVPYDRILAVDDMGDHFNEGPHLLVDFRQPEDPFESEVYTIIQPTSGNSEFLRVRELSRSNHLRKLRDKLRKQRKGLSSEEWERKTLREMQKVRREFVGATTSHVSGWYWDFVTSRVTANTETTQNLGKEKLIELKTAVKSLQEQAEETVKEYLDKKELWWDLKPGNQSYSYYGNRAPDEMDKAIRLAAGRLGAVLKEFGYLDKRENWREYDQSGSYHPHDARPYYPNWFEWNEEMRTLIERYEVLRSRLPSPPTKEAGQASPTKNELSEMWESL